jgi:hypothetical protein
MRLRFRVKKIARTPACAAETLIFRQCQRRSSAVFARCSWLLSRCFSNDAETASAPAVTARPSLRKATAFTALSCRRRTCSATSRRSDQRIADASKLPERAIVPSAETASARTGPPWPFSCARAGERPDTDPASMTHKNRQIRDRRIGPAPVSSSHSSRRS